MKVLGLIEQDLDIVSKEYVDKKLKEINKSGAEAPDAPEGYVRLDIPTLLIALPSESAPEYQTVGVDHLTLIGMFISQSIDGSGKGVFEKYGISGLTQEKLEEIVEKDSVVYVSKSQFKGGLEVLGYMRLDNVGFESYIKVDIPTLYMLSRLINSTLPKNATVTPTPDEWVLVTLGMCVDKNMKEIKTEGKTVLELANTVREVYIPKNIFDEVITSAITDDFTPIGKKKGYELMKTHYAIYLFSLAHRIKNSRLGQNQQFFKLMKDGYSVNEYDERKTLVNDLGFTYDESAPESSYDIDALSNFTNKHPEIYVPTEFTDYVKGTAEGTMGLFGAITNMMGYYEAHKDDPKIKIVTPNEYKINSKDPNTLYIVKES
jgi:hypothetical protein|nr:MAG TPA: hypothetical protein [Caudoviricetes sp.]